MGADAWRSPDGHAGAQDDRHPSPARPEKTPRQWGELSVKTRPILRRVSESPTSIALSARADRIERMFGRVSSLTAERNLEEQAAVLALVSHTDDEWYKTAALIEAAGSALRLIRGEVSALEVIDGERAQTLASRVARDDIERYERLIRQLQELEGARLLTILDEDYPLNLRFVYNRPPFLFVRGDLLPEDQRAVAVVGTRQTTDAGVEQAQRLSGELAREGVTVLSGLARGIDSAAHRAAVEAGGRTVAVLGTGIDRVYPPENSPLAGLVEEAGALVSQFWPGAPPTKYSFPMRNVVMSGMAVGTVVIEASSTSGARMQARLALEHGKRLFLVESLVMHEAWAERYAKHPATTIVRSVDDILHVLIDLARPLEQLTLG